MKDSSPYFWYPP
jgi:hypothetical protein